MHGRAAVRVAAGLALLAACAVPSDAPPTAVAGDLLGGTPALAAEEPFEVWLVDQSNSRGLAYGGAIHVWDGSELVGASADRAVPRTVIDLAGETDALCMASTGAHPVRPHMLALNATQSHAVLSFVASGHVVFFDAASRRPVACLRSAPGAGGARQAHAAIPSPDDAYVLIANQNGKQLERIRTDYASNTFVLESGATLNLATCTTPSGQPCESPALRPDNAPICPPISRTGDHAWVTLRGGGLFVVSTRATPMRILAEYDRATVHGNGCGGNDVGGHMYINSGGGTASNLTEFDVYQFPLDGYAEANPPNVPSPRLVFSRDGEPHRDAHRMLPMKGGRHLWAFDRGTNVAEVLDAVSGAHLGTVDLASALSADPTPDLAELSPSGNRIFMTLRGPNPLSGDPHVSTGSTPGLGVFQVEAGGRRGVMKAVVRISNLDAAGVERADPHGIQVRRR
ncbi:MAG TPA: hypothetical protein VEA99_01165 [Gemmatimonadaceae bacterium]|nr:hypothetical protein [Gemmatimonadaceae bacterium]